MAPEIKDYSELQQALLNNYQHGFPLVSNPYALIAQEMGVSETEVIENLKALKDHRAISRVGPVFKVGRVGCSTLAALSVAADELEHIAKIINRYDAVNHNYEREHKYNLWFVATAETQAELDAVLNDIEGETGYKLLILPMLEDYHIDLGFELLWS